MSALVVGILVLSLVAASAMVAVVTRPVSVLPAASVETIAEPGVPDAVLVSRTLFGASPTAVVVPERTDAASSAAAVELTNRNRVPMFRVAPTTVGAVADELRRLGVQQAVRIGGEVPDLGVPVTDDTGVVAGDAAPNGEGTVVLLSQAGDDAVATAQASGAETVSMPAPDPRVSGEAVRLLKEQPDAPVRAIGPGFGDRAQLVRRIELARTVPELPGGGQLMFPGRRVVALYGSPGAPELGPLGRQSIPASIARIKALAARYDKLSPVPVVPGFEIIVSVASADPGPGGNYTSVLDVAAIRPWVDAARKAGVYVTLDLQPGRTDFLTQAKMFRALLLEPHVGLALDPEWRLKPNQVHLTQIGSVEPAEVNRTSSWLADLVARNNLPQKALVLHQFDADMLGDRLKIDTSRDELAFVIHADGHGVPHVKMSTWNRIVQGLPPRTWLGWKNFFTEDKPMFSPKRTMDVQPHPWFISYQ
ncbi:hypothetical protein ACH46_01915 [Gordonia phthalatica]|uniref:Uncharacterized protein n=1 Tax=Gordonia phthalatica TaxID=1136941 RepID=A0A0N9NH89_9ACTN|nr:hypothetical protein ACH46_01915 [Gordonia phthalatica]